MNVTPPFSQGEIITNNDVDHRFYPNAQFPITKTIEVASRFFGESEMASFTPVQYINNQRWIVNRANDYLNHRSILSRFVDTILSFFKLGEAYKIQVQLERIKHPHLAKRLEILKQLDNEADWFAIINALDKEIDEISQQKNLNGDQDLAKFFGLLKPSLEQIVLRVKRSRTKDLIEVYHFISQNTTDAKELQLYILKELIKRSGKELTEHNFPRLLESIKTQVRKGDQKELLDKFNAKLNQFDETDRINRFQKEFQIDRETLSRIDRELVHIRDKKWANVDQERAFRFFTAYPSAEELMWSIKYARIQELVSIKELLDKESLIWQLINKEVEFREVVFKKMPS